MPEEILFYSRKDNGYGWLSNFWRAEEQDLQGCIYPTNEHFYQSMKAETPSFREWIRTAPTPYAAMLAGRSLRPKELVFNWDSIKSDIMYQGLYYKFSQNADLKEKLLATGDIPIHEDSPTDLYWGIKGKDVLGKLLIELREALKNI